MSESKPAYRQSLQDLVSDLQGTESFKFMVKNGFIANFLDHAAQDGIYDYLL